MPALYLRLSLFRLWLCGNALCLPPTPAFLTTRLPQLRSGACPLSRTTPVGALGRVSPPVPTRLRTPCTVVLTLLAAAGAADALLAAAGAGGGVGPDPTAGDWDVDDPLLADSAGVAAARVAPWSCPFPFWAHTRTRAGVRALGRRS